MTQRGTRVSSNGQAQLYGKQAQLYETGTVGVAVMQLGAGTGGGKLTAADGLWEAERCAGAGPAAFPMKPTRNSDTTCPSCGQRRGRRACPALGRQICAVCCGTKRLAEIACPPDCGYLSSARQHPPAVVQRRQEREGRFLAGVVHGLSETQYHLFLFLQMAVARHALQAVPALLDEDVAGAARAMADTAATAAKGIIYEHQSATPPAQRLTAALKAAIESLRKAGQAPREGDLLLALRATAEAAAGAAGALGGERAYVELVGGLFKPSAEGEAEDRDGPEKRAVILP